MVRALRFALVPLALGAASAVGYGCAGDERASGPVTTVDPSDPGPGAPPSTTTTSAEAGAPAPPAGLVSSGLSPSYVDVDVNHVLVTGQSNSVGNGGAPPLSLTQPFSNLMFDTGVMAMTPCDDVGCYGVATPTSFVPLVEGDSYFDYAVETPASGVANGIARLAKSRYGFGAGAGAPAKHVVLASAHGRSGTTYWCLRKGGCNYKPASTVNAFAQGMTEVTRAKAIAEAKGLSYAVRAVVTVHGESDHDGYVTDTAEFPLDGTDGTPSAVKDYTDALLEWQRDYEEGVKAITGQSLPVPMFVTQLSGWNNAPSSRIPQMQLDAHLRSKGKVVLVGPGYMLSPIDDCIHYDDVSERRLGEYVAKAYARVVFEGKAWEPLRPRDVTRKGAVVTVTFEVPVPPLVVDTARVAAAEDLGFDVVDASGARVPVTSAAVTGPDTVTITLASPPPAGSHVRYAERQEPGTCIGSGKTRAPGARGNLRDSDMTPSSDGDPLYDWAVQFDLPLP